jgi:hypothetical protein
MNFFLGALSLLLAYIGPVFVLFALSGLNLSSPPRTPIVMLAIVLTFGFMVSVVLAKSEGFLAALSSTIGATIGFIIAVALLRASPDIDLMYPPKWLEFIPLIGIPLNHGIYMFGVMVFGASVIRLGQALGAIKPANQWIKTEGIVIR